MSCIRVIYEGFESVQIKDAAQAYVFEDPARERMEELIAELEATKAVLALAYRAWTGGPHVPNPTDDQIASYLGHLTAAFDGFLESMRALSEEERTSMLVLKTTGQQGMGKDGLTNSRMSAPPLSLIDYALYWHAYRTLCAMRSPNLANVLLATHLHQLFR